MNKQSNVYFRYQDNSCAGYSASHDCYAPQNVKYAFGFYQAYYVHTWSQPSASDFGPGTQNGPYGSLGCIEIPDSVGALLYSQMPIGATIQIHS